MFDWLTVVEVRGFDTFNICTFLYEHLYETEKKLAVCGDENHLSREVWGIMCLSYSIKNSNINELLVLLFQQEYTCLICVLKSCQNQVILFYLCLYKH